MENHHREWENPLFRLGHFPASYVNVYQAGYNHLAAMATSHLFPLDLDVPPMSLSFRPAVPRDQIGERGNVAITMSFAPSPSDHHR